MTKPMSRRKLRDEFQSLEVMEHICAISRSEEEKLNTLTSFLLSGLSNNEKIICVVDRTTKEKILEKIITEENTQEINVQKNINSHLEFIIEEEIFHQNSYFDPERIIHLINYIIEKVPRSDFESFRIITDCSWIFKRKTGKQRMNEYTSRINELIIETEGRSLCLYEEDTSKYPALLNAILNHSKLVIQGRLCKNILYDSSSLLETNKETQLTKELYNSITQHLLKSEDKFVKTSEDITQRKKLVEEKENTEQRLKLMKHSLDSSLNGIVISDMNRTISYVNDAMVNLWGYEHPEDLIGKNAMDIIPYSYHDDTDFITSRESMAKTGKWTGDVQAKKHDGTSFWTRMNANLVYDGEGQPVAMMLSFIDITVQKEAEEALRISDEKSRRIIDNSPIGIMISSIDGKFISANKSAVDIFGYESEENFISSVNSVGIESKLYANPESRNKFVQFISDGRKWYKDENMFIRKDGNFIILKVQSHLTTDSKNTQIIETYIEDVTEKRSIENEREKAVQALIESEKKLTVLNEELEEKVKQRTSQMETLYGLIRDVSLSTNILEAMEVISDYLSKHGEYDIILQIIEQERLNHIHISTTSLDENYVKRAIEELKQEFAHYNPNVFTNKDKVVVSTRPNGSVNEPKTKLSIPLLVDDKIIGFILIGSSEKATYSEDEIWFLYRIADNISHTLEHLKAILMAKEELETVLNHSSNGIILLNSDKEIVMSNAVGKEVLTNLGINDGQGLDESLFNFELLLNFEKQEIVANEETYIVELSQIKTDFVHGMLLNIKNETDERKLQKLIMQQERLAIVGQLTGGVAHDFNNILASIIGAADFALMNLENLESQELLNLIIRQSERGASLIRQMLDFTRQTVIRPKPLNVQTFITEISRVLRASLPANIAFNVKNTISTVLMDQIQLQQLLMNLTFNSRDALPDGGEISIYINEVEHSEVKDFEEVEVDKTKTYVHFRVEDDGEGMSKQTIKKAFEPFFTTKGPGKGSGLGLSQVYGIVRQSNGYIFIESQLRKGTVVHFFVPKHIGEADEELFEETSRGKGKILLVEDDEDVRDITKIMLENYGFEVVSAINGKIALELYNDSFNLVLTDIIMPVMGGNELICELLKINPHIKCLAMTGYTDAQVPEGIEIIHKPMTSSKLVNHVQGIIGRSNGKKDLTSGVEMNFVD